ncbi:TPA: polysialyltransferase family glycosyltransferase [Providencia rettgeri]
MKMRILIGVNITSPYQFLSFISYYEEKKELYDEVVIFKYDYWGYNQIYKRYLDYFLELNGKLIENTSSLSEIISYLKRYYKEALFDFVTVNSPAIKLKLFFKNSNLIVIADGLGYYANFSTLINSIRRESKLSISPSRLTIMTIKYLIKKVFIKLISFEEYTLLRYKDLSLNQTYINNFKSIVGKLKGSIDISTPSLIFLDQPLVKLGIMNQDEYDRLLESAYKYSISLGLTFYIKEHPSSINSNQKYKIIKFDGLLEELCLLNNNIKHIMSYSSTGLFNILYLNDFIKVERTIKNKDINMSKKQNKILNKIPYFNLNNTKQ